MSTLNDLTALALPTGRRLVADETESRLCLSLEGQPLIQLRLTREPALHVQVEERFDHRAVWAACYWLFARDPACQRLTWHLEEAPPKHCSAGCWSLTKSSASIVASARCSGSCLSLGWVRH